MSCVREVPSGAASGFAGEELVRERERAGQVEAVGLLVKHWGQI
jgi:hypothetical protein